MKKKIVLWGVAAICVLPFLLMLLGSLKMGGNFTLRQYGMALLQTPQFFTGFWNSVMYTAVILAFNVPLGLLAAYGFSRFKFRGRDLLFWIYIVMMLMPFQATVVPQYLTLKWLNIVNTPWAVVLPNMFATFGTFLMTQYMRGFDKTLYEAAEIDGMSSFKTFTKLVAPICKPIISATAVLSFVNYWSLVEQPSLFLERASQQPLSVRLGGSAFGGVVFAAGVIFSVLPLLLYLYSYEDLQNGISLTANKSAKVDGKSREERRGKTAKKLALVFVVAMIFCTLATQKISDVMLPRVSTYDVSRRPQVLSEYETVVPDACIKGAQVFMIMESSFDGKSPQAVAMDVEVKAKEGGYSAVSAYLKTDTVLVCHASKPVRNGDLVKIIGEAFDEKNSD